MEMGHHSRFVKNRQIGRTHHVLLVCGAAHRFVSSQGEKKRIGL